MPREPNGTASPPLTPPRVRLDSWKEVADYLSKGERTAKRWESERSLPIHHVPGPGRGSVYAFTAELDEWLLSRKGKGATSSQEEVPESGGGAGKSAVAVAAGVSEG